MKNALKVVLLVACLSLPLLAGPNDWDKKKKKEMAVPEGGNWAAYTIVSGAAMFGALLLARKQRAINHSNN
jgi:hypothetical protein